MLHFPINLIKNLPVGTFDIQLNPNIYATLRHISMLAKSQNVPSSFDFTIVKKRNTEEFTIRINENRYHEWELFPARVALTAGAVSAACQISKSGQEPVVFAVDNEMDYGRLRSYVSRYGRGASCKREGNLVMVYHSDISKSDVHLAGVRDAISKDLESFIVEGSEFYVRQRVSSLNRMFGVKYRVAKLGDRKYSVTKLPKKWNTEFNDCARTFLAKPSQANADALIDVVRGMVESEQR